jgi:hypothetical protein
MLDAMPMLRVVQMISSQVHLPLLLAFLSYLEPIASHTVLVFQHEVGAILLGIIRVGEEHAFIAAGFLFGANAAWL